jgi:uncharacterized protein YfdQ (DUF2303 family)
MTTKDTSQDAAASIDAIKSLADKAGSHVVSVSLKEEIPGLPQEVPAFLDRESGSLASVANLFEAYRFAPSEKRGTAKVTTIESFIALTQRHQTADSAIFANTDWTKPSLTSVIDYHINETGGHADNGKHRIHYEFPLSDSWKAWIAIDGKSLPQVEFAEFIEDHIADLSAPDTMEEEDFRHKFSFKVAFPTQLVELSRGLQINSASRVKNAQSLQSGEAQIIFEEEHRDANGNKLDVPGMFILAIPPFFQGAPTRIPVRLRYRLSGGNLIWICKLYRPDVYITEQVVRDMEKAGSETGLPTFQGAPEMQG